MNNTRAMRCLLPRRNIQKMSKKVTTTEEKHSSVFDYSYYICMKHVPSLRATYFILTERGDSKNVRERKNDCQHRFKTHTHKHTNILLKNNSLNLFLIEFIIFLCSSYEHPPFITQIITVIKEIWSMR